MLLKVGFVMMAFAVALAGGVIALVWTDEPARSSAVKSADRGPSEPLERSDPGVEPWREDTVDPLPDGKPKGEEPEPVPDPEPPPEPAEKVRRESAPEPEPEEPEEPERPEPEPEPPPEPPEPEPEPDIGGEPPEPTREQLEAAHEPRHYRLPEGAVMGLTVRTIGLHDVPVFDSVGERALGSGVGHHPETSMPWTNEPQRNVYIAGHRLGFPGTDSHLVFYRLNELGEGDEIKLKDREGDGYRYRVTDAFKADPEDSWVMGQIRGRDMVTLQTCTGPNWERRLIVRAERV